jgi:hypothetical protein
VRNVDSENLAHRFDCFKFLFHSFSAETFATQSASRRHMQRSKLRLFDHLVGAGENRIRHGQAEGLGGLEIDDELELG